MRVLLTCCLVIFMGMVSAGCTEDVTFVTGTSRPFELYGYLDPTADTQVVRIFPIEEQLAPNLGDPLDAVVTSTDLETGDTVRWRDSLAAYDDGTHAYLFWASFRATSSHTYRLVARQSDGAESGATVSIVGTPELQAPILGDRITSPIFFEGAQTRVRALIVDYLFEYGKCGGELATFSFWHAPVSVAGGERVDIPLTDDRQEIREILDRFDRWNVSVGIVIQRITLRAVVTDAGWEPPAGRFDPEILVDPNAMTNVENGFGFVGSGYEVARHVFHPPYFFGPDAPRTPLSVEALKAAGFEMELPKGPVGCVGSWPPVGYGDDETDRRRISGASASSGGC